MSTTYTEPRICAAPNCGRSIAHRGPRAKTCGSRCRVKLSYYNGLPKTCLDCGEPFTTRDLGGPIRSGLCVGDYRARKLADVLNDRASKHLPEALKSAVLGSRSARMSRVGRGDLSRLSEAQLDIVGLALVDLSPANRRWQMPVIEEVRNDFMLSLEETNDAGQMTRLLDASGIVASSAENEAIAGEEASEIGEGVLLRCVAHVIVTATCWPDTVECKALP